MRWHRHFLAALTIVTLFASGCDSSESGGADYRISEAGIAPFFFGDSLGKGFDVLGPTGSRDFISGRTVGYQGFNWGDSITLFTTRELNISSSIEAINLRGNHSATTRGSIGIGSSFDELIRVLENRFTLSKRFFKFIVLAPIICNSVSSAIQYTVFFSAIRYRAEI